MGFIMRYLEKIADREREGKQAYWLHIENSASAIDDKTAAKIHVFKNFTPQELLAIFQLLDMPSIDELARLGLVELREEKLGECLESFTHTRVVKVSPDLPVIINALHCSKECC